MKALLWFAQFKKKIAEKLFQSHHQLQDALDVGLATKIRDFETEFQKFTSRVHKSSLEFIISH